MKQFFGKNSTFIILTVLYGVYLFAFIYFQTIETAWINPHIGFPVAPGDSSAYFMLAKVIQNSHHFSYSTSAPFIPESFRSPGYPAFIAFILALTHDQGIISLVQLLLSALTGWFIFDITKTFASKTIAWTSALLFLLNPATIFYSITALSDILFTFLLTGIVWMIYKKESILYHYGAFFLLGISTLVRPAASYILIVCLLCYALIHHAHFSKKKLLITSLLLCLTFIATITPWMYRNYREYHSFSISSIGPYTLLFFDMEEYKIQKGYDRNIIEETWLNQLQLKNKDEAYNPIYSKKISKIFIREFLTSPIHYSLFHFTGSLRLFIVSSISDVMNSMSRLQEIIHSYHATVFINLLEWIERILFSFLTILLFLSPAISYKSKDAYFGLLCFVLSVCLYTAIIIGPIPNARYRLSLLPCLLIGAGYSLSRLQKNNFFIKKVTPNRNNTSDNNL